MPVYVIVGDEGFLRHEALEALRAQLVTLESAAFGHKVMRGPAPYEVMEACQMVSFAPQVLIEVHGFEPLTKSSGDDKAAKATLDALKATLAELDETRHVVFTDESMDGKLALPKWLTSHAHKVEKFSALKPWEADKAVPVLVDWCRKQHIKISSDAAEAMANSLGPDLLSLTTEAEKLHAYTKGQPITVETVTTFLKDAGDSFEMLADWCMGERNTMPTRLNTLEHMLASQHPLQVFAQIQAHLGRMTTLKRLSTTPGPRPSNQQMAAETGLSPGRLYHEMKLLPRMSVQRLATLSQRATEAEWKAKTGQLDAEMALYEVMGL